MPRKLPLDVEEEILVRVPPPSLLRFRFVCEEWSTLFKSKRFVNKNFARGHQEFMIKTHSHIYSISVDLNDEPTIKLTDLRFNSRRLRYHVNGFYDGYFFMEDSRKGCFVWNPWLRHTQRIAKDEQICGRDMGHDGGNPEKSCKIIGRMSINSINRVAVLKFATNTWEITHRDCASFGGDELASHDWTIVSLNGNLYWTGDIYPDTGECFIQMLDFSKEMIKIFCILPCKGKKSSSYTRALSIYKGDRFAVLQQRTSTREIKIWVTEKRIGNGDDGDNVVWIKFMNVSRPNFPLVLDHMSVSYFVDHNIFGKSFVLCCYSKRPKQAWVYVVRGDMCKNI